MQCYADARLRIGIKGNNEEEEIARRLEWSMNIVRTPDPDFLEERMFLRFSKMSPDEYIALCDQFNRINSPGQTIYL